MSDILVIGLNGSPHSSGNTAALLGWILDGCAETGARVEWLHIIDHHIQYCQGCHTCLRTGECPLDDDFHAVRNRLLAAQGIVVGSPVYEGQPSARLSTLLDQLCLLNLYGYLLDGKFSAGAATSGVAPTGGVAGSLADFFGRSAGTVGGHIASLSGGFQPLAQQDNPRLRQRARALGRKLVQRIRQPAWRSLTPKYLWIEFLRRNFLKHLITRNPAEFAGVLEIWRRRGLIK